MQDSDTKQQTDPVTETSAMPETAQGLSPEELAHYVEHGYVGPFTLCSPEEMAVIKERVLSEVLATDSPHPIERMQSRHLDSRLIYDLVTHPEICSRITSIYGPDLVLWRSQLFDKKAGEGELGWHQDIAYFHMLEPPINVSAWIAISDANVDNGCMELVPGSHRRVLTHVPIHQLLSSKLKRKVGLSAPYLLRPTLSRKQKAGAIPMEVRAGQFFLFNERLLHNSGANHTDEARVGIAARITLPMVHVTHDQIFKGHTNVVVRGQDTCGHNQLSEPPA